MESFFPSWDDVQYNYREVVLFACGLMSDPTPLVDHVYQMWIEKELKEIRKGEYDGYGGYKYKYNTDLLEEIYAESKVQLPLCPLHNNNINYYDHAEDNRRHATHVYTPSKLYMFLEMKENVLHQIENREHKVKIPECALVIQSPDTSVTNSLLVNIQRVIENQAIVDLRMFGVSCKFPLEPEVLNLSKNAHSLLMRSCSLPSQLLQNVVHKLSDCNRVSIIDFWKTSLEDVSSLTISNKTSLTHLDLCGTNMSAELCKSICEQLTDITDLEYLNMAENDLSLVSIFTLNNKRSLRHLDLRNTHISSTLYYTIVQQLNDFESLKGFDVSREDLCYKIGHSDESEFLECFLSDKHLPSHVCRRVLGHINRFSNLWSIEITDSPLTGCLSSFLPDYHPGLPELAILNLKETSISKKDLHHLSNIIQSNKLPKL